jgi:hypothetical protein
LNDNAKIVFDSKYPFFGIFTLVVLPLCSAILFLFLLTQLKEHPIIASGLGLFALLIIIGANAEKIVVQQDRFTIITRRLIPALTTRKVFLYSQVGSMEVHLPLTQLEDVAEAGSNYLRYNNVPGTRTSYKENTLIVRYKDDVEVTLTPSIYRASFHKALTHIAELSHIPISIQDKPA